MNEDQLNNGPAKPSEQPISNQPAVNGQLPQNPQPFVSGDMSQNPQTFTGGQPAPQQPIPGNQPMPATPQGSGKLSKKILVGIAGIVLLLLLAIAGFFVLTTGDNGSSTDDKSSSGTQSEVEADNSQNSAVTADSVYDYEQVCTGGSVLNASEYTEGQESTKVVAFTKSRTLDSYTQASVGYGESYYVDSDDDVSSIAVVGCLEYIEGSEAMGKVCEYQSAGEVNVYSSKYSLTYYSAKSGEKVGEGPSINAPVTRCPGFISYDKETKKAYAPIDTATLGSAISSFVE